MIDEAFFQAALDADPAWSAARFLFAEWLAERGDWRAAGYRWMASNWKHPRCYDEGPGKEWGWWVYDSSGRSFVLPCDLFRTMTNAGSCHSFHPTRRAAEEALCRALTPAAAAGSPRPPGLPAPASCSASP